MTMKKTTIILLALFATALSSAAQEAYTILSERDTTVKAKISGISLGSREIKHIVYEYPSTDADGKEVKVSGVILIPSDVLDGSTPCDGVIMYNHPTIGSPADAPSQGGSSLDALTIPLASPLRPNYIFVAADYIGYGSSIDSNVSYISGDTNSRNALDGLLAARQLFEDRQVPQGKYLFNMGFSQGGTVSMYAGRLTDTDDKYRDIRFDKTFSGGGPLDFEQIYSIYVKRDACDDIADVILMLISVNENYHLGIDYNDMFKEPVASKALEYFKAKDKSVVADVGVMAMDSIHEVLTPEFMDLNSEMAQKLRAKLKEISLTEGWEPDITKRYYVEHSRHDNYVPIQSVRSIIPWMKEKGFKPSLVPGKSTLQTNTMVFKLKHQQSAIVWAIQTLAAIQFWPVLYYEGEQNRYFHDVVGDMNLMKVIKYLESWGLDLRKLIDSAPELQNDLAEGFEDGSIEPDGSVRQLASANRASFFDILGKITEVLAKVDLTLQDAYEMLDDSGISIMDIMEVVNYVTGSSAPDTTDTELLAPLERKVEAPLYLLRYYEQELAKWYLLAGLDANIDMWGM
jgi:hypothetical protein